MAPVALQRRGTTGCRAPLAKFVFALGRHGLKRHCPGKWSWPPAPAPCLPAFAWGLHDIVCHKHACRLVRINYPRWAAESGLAVPDRRTEGGASCKSPKPGVAVGSLSIGRSPEHMPHIPPIFRAANSCTEAAMLGWSSLPAVRAQRSFQRMGASEGPLRRHRRSSTEIRAPGPPAWQIDLRILFQFAHAGDCVVVMAIAHLRSLGSECRKANLSWPPPLFTFMRHEGLLR